MYNIAIALYAFIVRLVSPFNKKAKKMLAGQRETFSILKKEVDCNARYIWFHAASLGEFEQGRPLMEKIKKEKPEYKILLTFFSPSGYEVRKNYEGADIVCYLPFDYLRNAQKFINLAKPEITVFIKYEFWMNYLNGLKKRNIPTYIISAIFRPSQIFFRWYGRKYRNVLNDFEWFFVQNETSKELLNKFNHNNITVSGDTRFDRVKEISEQKKQLPAIENFLNQKAEEKQMVLVAGSTWENDEDVLIPYFNKHPEIKLIIAPHEISEDNISRLSGRLKRPYLRYSQTNEKEPGQADCLIIDCYGLLYSIYKYGNIAYIGGGFGKGIHNILEAAVYGVPVLFGPNHAKFREAKDLIDFGGAFPITDKTDFSKRLDALLTYPNLLSESGEHAKGYVIANLGATQKIFSLMFR
jgi:3-deoxy-D-manno-octulosonic-acid transferase